MKPYLLCLLVSVVMVGCQSGNQKSQTGDLHVIDLSQDYPEKEIRLQDIADITYIPLETTNDVLIGGNARLSYISNVFVLIWDISGDIFIFNRDGKIASHFNHRGMGDKEYPNISNVVIDEKMEEIYVFANSVSRILVYSLTGEYKRILSFSSNITRMKAYNFDDDNILIYDESGLQADTYSETPYMIISKQDGSTVSVLDIKLPVRFSTTIFNTFTGANGEEVTQPIMVGTPHNRHFGSDFVIADIASDTIYQLTKNGDLSPLLVRTPSVHSSEPRTIWTSQLRTDKFILLWKILLDFTALKTLSVPFISLIYDFETGQTNKVSFVNNDFLSETCRFYQDNLNSPKNVFAFLMDMTTLTDAYEENNLRGELAELVPTLDEEDNPVLVIVNFK
jgi:hypothetical protein